MGSAGRHVLPHNKHDDIDECPWHRAGSPANLHVFRLFRRVLRGPVGAANAPASQIQHGRAR